MAALQEWWLGGSYYATYGFTAHCARRDDSPLWFWFGIACKVIFAIFCAVFAAFLGL